MADFPASTRVDVVPHYELRHVLGSVALGIFGVSGLIATMTGPPSFISKEHWEVLWFASIIITTFIKSMQSRGGASTAAPPKTNP